MSSKLLVTALCLVLLCACSPLSLNTEDLLVPPRLSERQAKVEEAFSSAVNPGLILYRYPRQGDYRSPFVFYDIDHDNRQEVIIFYSYQTDTENVRAKILREADDGAWTLAYDLSGQGDQVDFLQFASLVSTDSECMLIGWHDSRRDTSSLSVYTFEGSQFKREVNMSYRSLSVDAYLSDGLRQIALIRQDSFGLHSLALLGKTPDGRIASLGEVALSPEINSILQMRHGLLWDGSSGIFIDERRLDTYIATEVVRASSGNLTILVGEDFPTRYERTFRLEETLSQDLMNNGIVYIPTLTILPGYFSENEIAPPPLTEYIRLNETADFNTIYSAVINDEEGYLVLFPERWLGAVTVLRRPESNEWQFYKIDPVGGMPTTELLRIRVYSTRDYKDRFTSDYILLAEKGLFQYEAYIPPTTGEPLALSEAELRRLFMLL